MIVYRHKFFDALDDEERKMDREEREERRRLEKERKKNIENRTKYNTFLTNYRTQGTSWGREKAKRIAKELDKKGYSDEEILDEASSTPFFDDTAFKGVSIGGIAGLGIGGSMLLSKKFRKGHSSDFLKALPGGVAASGAILGGAVGNIGARIKRKEAIRELLEQRRKDEEERRGKK
jgi:hypothetical protein